MGFPFFRLVKFSLKDFYRNFWLSLVTIITITLALLSINFLITVRVLANAAVDSVRDKVDISIYFKHQASERLVKSARDQLLKLPQVAGVRYISKEEALERFEREHRENPVLKESLEELGDNPLGHTLVIKAETTADYASILAGLDDFEFSDSIESKNYNNYQLIISRLDQVSDNVNTAGMAVIVVFAFISALVVFNTMRVIIYARGEEIGIMKLVGATDKFIRAPFILESILYSVIAWIITHGIFYQLLKALRPYLVAFFGGEGFDITAYFRQNFLYIFGIQFLLLVALNAISSSIATRKYLDV